MTENVNKIIFQFSNGFFKFKVDENQFIISYWTPLRSLMQVIDSSFESPVISSSAQVIDEKQKGLLSPTISRLTLPLILDSYKFFIICLN